MKTKKFSRLIVSLVFCLFAISSFASSADAANYKYVASKNGSVFHLPSCYHVDNILPSNYVTFDSLSSALASGRTGCSYCNPILGQVVGSGNNSTSGGSYNSGYDDGYDEGYSEGYDEGYIIGNFEGYMDGCDDGQEEGYNEGLEEGKSIGYKEGLKEGRSKANRTSGGIIIALAAGIVIAFFVGKSHK